MTTSVSRLKMPAGRPIPRACRRSWSGTGGIGFYKFRSTAPNSVARNDNTYGVLQLALRAGTPTRGEFVPVAGGTYTRQRLDGAADEALASPPSCCVWLAALAAVAARRGRRRRPRVLTPSLDGFVNQAAPKHSFGHLPQACASARRPAVRGIMSFDLGDDRRPWSRRRCGCASPTRSRGRLLVHRGLLRPMSERRLSWKKRPQLRNGSAVRSREAAPAGLGGARRHQARALRAAGCCSSSPPRGTATSRSAAARRAAPRRAWSSGARATATPRDGARPPPWSSRTPRRPASRCPPTIPPAGGGSSPTTSRPRSPRPLHLVLVLALGRLSDDLSRHQRPRHL